MSKYLVTGGCGFVGSHLCDLLIACGHEVVILDDLSTGHLRNAPKEAQVIVGDAVDYDVVAKAFDGIDGCFHLAAVASVQKSVIDWVNTHKTNVTAAVNVFQLASRAVKKVPVVYASSAAIYGDNTNIPIQENEIACPQTAYGVDKYSCELHGKIAWDVHQVPTFAIRPFNIYGERQDPSSPYSGVISIFANHIKAKKDITIFGDGLQERDFIYVQDIVNIFYQAMLVLVEKQHGAYVVNGCTGHGTTLNHLVDIIENICSTNVEHIFKEARTGDIKKSIGDSTQLQEILNIPPAINLEDGLSRLIESL